MKEDSIKGEEPTFDGPRLRAMRKQRRPPVNEVGQIARVTARHIWRLEAHQRPNVAAVTLGRIASALGVDMGYLMRLTDSPQPGGGKAGR